MRGSRAGTAWLKPRRLRWRSFFSAWGVSGSQRARGVDPCPDRSVLRPERTSEALGLAGVTLWASDRGLVLAMFLVSSSDPGGSRPTCALCVLLPDRMPLWHPLRLLPSCCSVRPALPVQPGSSGAAHRTRPRPSAVGVALPWLWRKRGLAS